MESPEHHLLSVKLNLKRPQAAHCGLNWITWKQLVFFSEHQSGMVQFSYCTRDNYYYDALVTLWKMHCWTRYARFPGCWGHNCFSLASTVCLKSKKRSNLLNTDWWDNGKNRDTTFLKVTQPLSNHHSAANWPRVRSTTNATESCGVACLLNQNQVNGSMHSGQDWIACGRNRAWVCTDRSK